MSTVVPSQATATKTATKSTTTIPTNKKAVINNPHRVQVLVDFPDPTITIKPVDSVTILGPQRKFIAVADGDKSFYELKHVINDELHRLYAEEAPYGLCGFKNWQYCKVPERYLIRDVLGKQCDIHVTRELLSAKKLGKSTKRKIEEGTSSSSSSSSPATTATSHAAGPSAPAPKAKKTKKEAVATPAAAAKTESKAIVKKEAIANPVIGTSKETAKDKALQSAYASLTEEQIMMNISAAHAQEKKKVTSGIATPEASESSASPVPAPVTPKKQKSAKKAADAIETPAPTPAPTKAAETKVNKTATTIPFPQDSEEKSEEDIMKEISAYHQAQKLMGEMDETVRKAEEIKIMKEVSEKHVSTTAVVEVKEEQLEVRKEQAKAKKEQAKAAKAAAKDAEGSGKEARSKAKKAAVTSAAKESSEPAGSPATAKGKKVVEKGYQSDDSSEPVAKGKKKSGARRKEENVEELERWEAQDPATLTDEQSRELQLWHKRKYNRKSNELKRSAQLASKSADPEFAAAATLFLQETTRRGRPSVASESLRTKFEKFIKTSDNTTSDGDDDGDSEDESSSASSSPKAEAQVKEEPQQQRIKVEPKAAVRKELSSSDSESDSNSA
ncbi:hypothetical protein BGZ96_009877 [Linnemannia gamsii]|uniref:Nucleolar protein Dnt1-like N-terminal domain-containing protein n=1 Tax=Linnemannia gamsii TaxID=64522 RepID=A0ABQ7JVL1_9FUNG|nr:hypothetical protein BGZ96_009877 [Linnemannia gamsii]